MKDDRDEIIDKLAKRIADEEDRKARQRQNEFWMGTPQQQSNFNMLAWLAAILGLLIILSIFWMAHH